jgi:hypothetical protein
MILTLCKKGTLALNSMHTASEGSYGFTAHMAHGSYGSQLIWLTAHMAPNSMHTASKARMALQLIWLTAHMAPIQLIWLTAHMAPITLMARMALMAHTALLAQ